VKSEGNSPTGSEDYKLGESGCAKKRWLQQAISEQGININYLEMLKIHPINISFNFILRFSWNEQWRSTSWSIKKTTYGKGIYV
jgi:hypothetical protein